MFERAQKNQMRDYIGVSIYRYVCIYNQNMADEIGNSSFIQVCLLQWSANWS